MNKFVMVPHEQFLKFKKYLEIEKQGSYKSNTADEESEQLNNAVTSSKAETGSNESLYMSPPPGLPESSVDRRLTGGQKTPNNPNGGRVKQQGGSTRKQRGGDRESIRERKPAWIKFWNKNLS